MPGSAEFVQRLVHSLETGASAVWMRRGLVLAGIAALSMFYLGHEFQGLATSQAMDQAQIGREIARGHFWQTKFARPRGIGQLLAHGKDVPRKIWTDTYNALPPMVVCSMPLLPLLSE
jgi:hypothetical protein